MLGVLARPPRDAEATGRFLQRLIPCRGRPRAIVADEFGSHARAIGDLAPGPGRRRHEGVRQPGRGLAPACPTAREGPRPVRAVRPRAAASLRLRSSRRPVPPQASPPRCPILSPCPLRRARFSERVLLGARRRTRTCRSDLQLATRQTDGAGRRGERQAPARATRVRAPPPGERRAPAVGVPDLPAPCEAAPVLAEGTVPRASPRARERLRTDRYAGWSRIGMLRRHRRVEHGVAPVRKREPYANGRRARPLARLDHRVVSSRRRKQSTQGEPS